MSRVLEIYRGYEIVTGQKEYGAQFAYAWRKSDESSLNFCNSPEECRREIDDETGEET